MDGQAPQSMMLFVDDDAQKGETHAELENNLGHPQQAVDHTQWVED